MIAKVALMPKKPKAEVPGAEPPATGVIRVDFDLAEMIGLMSRKRRINASDLVSPLIRQIIEREYARFLEDLTKGKPHRP